MRFQGPFLTLQHHTGAGNSILFPACRRCLSTGGTDKDSKTLHRAFVGAEKWMNSATQTVTPGGTLQTSIVQNSTFLTITMDS